MFTLTHGRSLSGSDHGDATPRGTPDGPLPRLADLPAPADTRHLRLCAEHDGWPAHCPDPRCGGRTERGGIRCRGALRRLSPGRPRGYPSCYAFAFAALQHEDDLAPAALLRAYAMLPVLMENADEARVGGPDPSFAGPSPGPAGARLAERLLARAIDAADGAELSGWLVGSRE